MKQKYTAINIRSNKGMGGLEAKVFSLKNEDSETQIVKLAIQIVLSLYWYYFRL